MTLDLNGTRVLVVGASGGIGGATADAFAAAGAGVTRPGRDTLDITDDGSVEAFFAGAEPFDHVIVAAARTRTGPVAGLALLDAQAEDIAQAILFVATNPYATGSTVTVDGGGTIAA